MDKWIGKEITQTNIIDPKKMFMTIKSSAKGGEQREATEAWHMPTPSTL